jgi:outer membrane protein insertion porin family
VPLLLATRTAAQSSPVKRESPEVRKLVWRGVHNVTTYELEHAIGTEASQCRSLLLAPFCLFSRAPAFVEKHHLDREELQKDVIRIRVLYYKHGYRDAIVDTSITANHDGVTVAFNVTEGEPTRIAAIRVDYDSTVISRRRVERLSLLRAGDPLDLMVLDSARLLLRDEMWNTGYADAVVDTSTSANDETNTGAAYLRLTPNARTMVGAITIQGEDRIDESTIRNMLSFREGDIYRRRDALESQRNLYESNLFRQAIVAIPSQPDSVKQVNISVTEGKLHQARVGGGFNTIDFFQAEARYSSFNTFGGARRLDFTASAGNLGARMLNGRGIFRDILQTSGTDDPDFLQPTWAASVDFLQPAFLRRPQNALGFSVFGHRRSISGVYIDRGYGAAAVFTRHVSPRAPASATYRFEITRVEASDVFFCINYGVCDDATITALRSHQKLSPVALTGFVDRSDRAFSPTQGYTARLDLEHASSVTLSDYRYNRGYFDGAAYTHFRRSPENVFAFHLRLGLVLPLAGSRSQLGISVLHPRKRFYAGGASSVRGYAENQLGPRILTIAPQDLENATTATGEPCDVTSSAVRFCDPNTGSLPDRDFEPRPLGGTSLVEGSVEYRFPTPIHRKLNGAVFIDGALVGERNLRKISDIQGLARGTGAITPGFGIRYQSPVGPIRVDVGLNPKISEDLPVVTELVQNGTRQLVPLSIRRTYSPAGGSLLSRLVLHLSIGQAF